METLLDRLLGRIDRAEFRRSHLGRAPLHVKGPPDLVAGLMSWDGMSRLMSMTGIWTPDTLQVVMDCKMVPPSEYCGPGPSASGGEAQRPDPAKVQALIRRGASVVLNGLETLTPEIRALCNALREMTGGWVQANLYFSMRERQAFAPHFDAHDVYAVHCSGEKTWQVFEGSEDAPVHAPAFTFGAQEMVRRAGRPVATYDLAPGDLLYIPRGRYHDALASANGAIHIAFGVTMPKALDLLSSVLWRHIVMNPEFRADLPVRPDATALAGALARIGDSFATMLGRDDVRAAVAALLRDFPMPTQGYDIAALIAQDVRFEVAPGIRLAAKDGRTLLGKDKTWVEVPAGLERPIAWVLGRTEVTEAALGAAFSAMSRDQVRELVGNLRSMNVLR